MVPDHTSSFNVEAGVMDSDVPASLKFSSDLFPI